MSGTRWLVALLLAVALHLVAFMSVEVRSHSTGAQVAGRDGLLVSLAPAGDTAGTTSSMPEPVAEPQPEPEPVVESEPEQQPDPRVVETEPDPPEPPPEPEPERREEPEPVEKMQTEEAEKEQVAGHQARAGSGGGTEAATTRGTAGGGNPGARADYLARVQALLARYKEYPRRARIRRIEGTVRVRFMLHPDGRITDASIIGSSGHGVLDESARKLLARAGRVPPFPEDMEQHAFSLELPIEYSLR